MAELARVLVLWLVCRGRVPGLTVAVTRSKFRVDRKRSLVRGRRALTWRLPDLAKHRITQPRALDSGAAANIQQSTEMHHTFQRRTLSPSATTPTWCGDRLPYIGPPRIRDPSACGMSHCMAVSVASRGGFQFGRVGAQPVVDATARLSVSGWCLPTMSVYWSFHLYSHFLEVAHYTSTRLAATTYERATAEPHRTGSIKLCDD